MTPQPTLQLTIPDMACGNCATAIQQAVLQVDATATVTANLETKAVEISTQAEAAAIEAAIQAAGYTIAR